MMKTILYTFKNEEDRKIHLIPDNLPKPPFTWIISAMRNSGKTQFVFNLLFNDEYGYKNYFDEIYVFIGSKDDYQKYLRLSKKHNMNDNMTVEYNINLEELNELYDEIEEENEEAIEDKINTKKILFVLDDLIYKNMFSSKSSNILNRIFMNGRHAGISLICTSQKFRAIGDKCRKNATAITIFPSSLKDMEALAEEYHDHRMNKDKLLDMIQKEISKKYTKFTIDMDKEEKFRNNDFEPIDIKKYI